MDQLQARLDRGQHRPAILGAARTPSSGLRERVRAGPALLAVTASGVVLDAVPTIMSHAACLGCQWFEPRGDSPLELARRHETSDGAFR